MTCNYRLPFRDLILAFMVAGSLLSARAAEPVVVGQIASTSNALVSEVSTQYNKGIALAFDRVNRAGGIGGRPLKLVLRDDGFDPAKTAGIVEELVNRDGAVALIGNVGSPAVLRLAESGILESRKLASFSPFAGLQAALGAPQVFPVRKSYEDEVSAMFEHSVRLGRRRVAFVAFELGAGPALAKAAPELARQAGAQLVGPVLFRPDKNPVAHNRALDEALAKIASSDYEAAVVIASGPAASRAIEKLRQLRGKALPIYTLSFNPAEQLARDLGADGARGVMITQVMPPPRSTSLQVVLEFRSDLTAAGETATPGYTLLEGYVAGRIAAEVIRLSPGPLRESILRTAAHIGELNVGGFRVSYSPKARRSLNPVEITMISGDGRIIR